MRARAVTFFSGIVLFPWLCFAGLLPFTLGVTLLALLGAGEFVAAYRRELAEASVGRAGRQEGKAPSRLNPTLVWIGTGYPLIIYLGSPVNRGTAPGARMDALFAIFLNLLIGLFALLLLRAIRTGKALGSLRAWYGLIGMAYIGLLFSGFVLLRGLPGRIAVPLFGMADRGAWLMILTAACVWATDTGAYLVGRAVGRHKLAPGVSPGKTVEGAFGGLAAGLVVGVVLGSALHLSMRQGLAVGAISAVAGQLGDLFESALKREIGIKDFGHILPGHGGVLDRFDSLLFAVPLVYGYLRFFGGS